MVSIKFMAPSHHVSSEDLSRIWMRYSPGGTGRWGNLQITTDSAEAEYFIMPERGSDPKSHRGNTVYVQREPQGKLKAALRKAFLGVLYQTDYHAATWWVSQSYDELKALPCPPKPKQVSAVVTKKSAGLGRQLRLRFLVALARQTDIDVYGNFVPSSSLSGFHSMGRVTHKEQGLLDYRFSVAMEWCSLPGYFSEKFIDPLLCWCKPIYFGPPNIDAFFPRGSYAWVDPSKPDAVDRALRAMQEPIDYEAIAEARHRILDYYNIMPTLARKLGAL